MEPPRNEQANVFISLYCLIDMQNLCYVAYDYEAELRKNTEASYEVPVEGYFNLKQERFRTGEILFQPRLHGLYVHVFSKLLVSLSIGGGAIITHLLMDESI